MNLYGCFTPEFNHMLLFGQLWHADELKSHLFSVHFSD